MKQLDVTYSRTLSDMAREICIPYYHGMVDEGLLQYYVETFQSEEAIRDQIAQGHIYSFITSEDEVIGYYSVYPKGDVLFLSKLYIKEGFRGLGFGSGSFDEIFEIGRSLKLRCVRLNVNKNNISSIRIYTAKGFTTVATDNSDIGGGFHVDDLIMEYNLK